MTVEVPLSGFVDEGDGIVSFPNGLTITDGTVQRNGTTYDIDTLDVSCYGNQLTGDHEDKLSSLIGEVIGVAKRDGKVVVNKIRYAINENPYARLAYNLLIGGFSKNFSTETIGPAPDHNGVWKYSELVGLSQVVTQNNYNAHVNLFNKVVHNSLEQSKQDGLDVTGIEEKVLTHVKEENKMEEKDKKDTEVVEAETKTTQEVTDDSVDTKKEAPQAPVVEQATDKSEVLETPHLDTQENEVEKEETDEAAKTEEVVETENNEVEKTQNETDKVASDKNGVYVEKTVTITTHESEYIESEEEKAEQAAREAKWEADEQARLEAEKAPDVIVVVQDANNDVSTESEKDKKETNNKETEMDEKDKKVENSVTLSTDQLKEVIANALAPISKELEAVRQEAKNAFDASAKEPAFKKEDKTEVAKNDYKAMDWKDRYNEQVEAAWNAVKIGSVESWAKLREINSVNLEALKEAGVARNSITLEELGNFVIPPEMYNEIQGHRNDYTAILGATEWKETMSLEFAWLQRVGDINMRNVALGETDAAPNGNLKPISEYSAVPKRSSLEELAAVTVVATSATRFAAVDLLADAAAGYRNDFDRKRAQLVIAKLETAIDETGFTTAYNPTTDLDALDAWLDAITAISDTTLNGTLIFNARTFAELKSRALRAGANGPLSEILTTGEFPTVWGYRFIVVPNDLMPSLGGSETVAHYVDGVAKTINHAVFFADLSTFTGRTSGGLQYDVSNSAPYEVGGVVKSAYQRNELVLRGSFFRGGAVKDVQVVAGIRQGNSANVS